MFKKIFKIGKKKEDTIESNKIEESENAKESTIFDIDKSEENITDKEETVVEATEFKIADREDEKINDNNVEVEEIIEQEEIIDDVQIETEDIEVEDEQQKEIVETEEIIDDNFEVTEEVGLFTRLKQGLTKAKQGITDKIDAVLNSYTTIDEELLEELEEILITADVGVNTTMEMIDNLRNAIKSKGLTDPLQVRDELKTLIVEMLGEEDSKLNVEPGPSIILMVGVNGVGKTTTIGKLANRYTKEGKKVMLAAGDTFRAAAIEQLEVWANRSNVDIIKHQEGADPGAVIFDAVKAAKARKADILICDTAGRLHNKTNLMNELGKVFKIVDREYPEAKKEVLLVVDATTGQNAVSQAKTFKEVADITGIVLTKLDGTAKGGVVLAVKSEVDVPVKLIGVGEKVEDLQDFNSKAFIDALFGN